MWNKYKQVNKKRNGRENNIKNESSRHKIHTSCPFKFYKVKQKYKLLSGLQSTTIKVLYFKVNFTVLM